MYVVKRDGSHEEVHFDKITTRIKKLCYGLDKRYIDPVAVAMKVVQGIYSGVTTRELDQLTAETCAYSSTYHPDWSILAARIAVSDLHKCTEKSFAKNCATLFAHVHPKTGTPAPLIAEDVNAVIQANAERFDAAIDSTRDFDFDYFGFKTLERSYLLRMHGEVAERPQQMFMRVSVGIHKQDVDAALETYHLMSQRYFTHATPTLFNAGTPRPQLSSCFLLTMKEDSIDGIYETLKNCACISKYAGGIGLSIHNIRATNSYIRGTNGTSNGLVPMLRVYSDTARYVDQGGGKRKGSFAIYLEPWHADVFDFLELKKNSGKEEMRARDLFYALWIPDLFMERVEANGNWSLFCPNEAPRLADTVGAEFKALYESYEAAGRQRRTVRAQELWFAVLQAQIETGTPYMLYKDACNLKSNQQNLGVIKSSNLCTEIIEFTSPDEIAVCNLASVALNMFVSRGPAAIDADGAPASAAVAAVAAAHTPVFDFQRLLEVTKVATRNLNKVIDVNFYPVPEARNSNMRHRPIGLGVQGLADCLALMRLPFECDGAILLNKQIFETLYYGALWASTELAEVEGPYESYKGSPMSKGLLQPDLWGVTPSDLWDWSALRARVVKHGARNSLLLAPMPTASTAQILGNNESIEPFTSNIYTRRVLAGEFPMVNRHLLKDLIERGLWTPQMRLMIISDKGSVQRMPAIPDDVKDLYKTVWEIKQRNLIDMAADRGAFICQSQSLNLFIADPTISKLTSMHFYGWKKGLKTGMYYLRTKPKADAIQFTVDSLAVAEAQNEAGIRGDFVVPVPPGAEAALGEGAGAALGVAGEPLLRTRVDSVDSSVTGDSESSESDTGVTLAAAADPAAAAAAAAAGGAGGEDKAGTRSAHKAEMAALREALRQNKEGYGEDEGVCLNCSA